MSTVQHSIKSISTLKVYLSCTATLHSREDQLACSSYHYRIQGDVAQGACCTPSNRIQEPPPKQHHPWVARLRPKPVTQQGLSRLRTCAMGGEPLTATSALQPELKAFKKPAVQSASQSGEARRPSPETQAGDQSKSINHRQSAMCQCGSCPIHRPQ